MVERAKFNRLVRHQSETFKDFSLRVHQQSGKGHFNYQLETQLRDRHVDGINHTELEKQLLGEKKLIYAKTKELIFKFDKVSNAFNSDSTVVKVFHKKIILFS